MLACLATLAMVGCASVPKPRIWEVAPGPAKGYSLAEEKGGLRLAIDPYLDKERIRASLGPEMLSTNLIPVLVIAENESPEAVFAISREQSSLLLRGPEDSEDVPGDESRKGELTKHEARALTSGRDRSAAAAATLLIAPPAVSLPTALIVDYLNYKGLTNQRVLVQNITRTELSDRTLFPGASHHGFLFFSLPGDVPVKRISAILLKARNVRTNEVLTFLFPIGPDRKE